MRSCLIPPQTTRLDFKERWECTRKNTVHANAHRPSMDVTEIYPWVDPYNTSSISNSSYRCDIFSIHVTIVCRMGTNLDHTTVVSVGVPGFPVWGQIYLVRLCPLLGITSVALGSQRANEKDATEIHLQVVISSEWRLGFPCACGTEPSIGGSVTAFEEGRRRHPVVWNRCSTRNPDGYGLTGV